MTSSTRQARRTLEQWQVLVDQHAQSELSAPQFCSEQDISYQSFMNWRKRLGINNANSALSTTSETSFIELTDKGGPSVATTERTWYIELDLAPGIQLRIAR